MNLNHDGFTSLLKLSGITNVYFIDDYLPLGEDIDSLLVLIGTLSPDQMDTIKEYVDLSKVPAAEIGNVIRTYYDGADAEIKAKFAQKIHEITEEHYAKEVKATTRLLELFPGSLAKGIHPTHWDNFKKEKLTDEIKNGKALIFLDQDLRNAEGFSSRKGIDLIIELSKEPYFDRLTCILISNDISATKDELPTRNHLIKELGLNESDFFPLSKKRLDVPDHFYDGVKKSMLNRYCEVIKELTVTIIEKSYSNALKRVKAINTYDFDHAIFQSSYEEGVWEIETLFRISDLFIDEEVKNIIIDSGFQKKINVHLRKAKSLSDVRFKIEKYTEPYAEKYKLRHLEIYEAGAIINKMFKPIDNGDIFEIYNGNEDSKGFYILLGQECDLMVRKDGDRESKLGFLYRINDFELERFLEITTKHYQDHQRDFYDAKFKLDYFWNGTNDVGIVSFKNPIVVDLKILDLVAFNSDGLAKFDLKNSIDTSVLSFAWEKRYQKTKEFLNQKSGWSLKTFHALKKLDSADSSVKDHLMQNNRLRLSFTRPDVGPERTLDKDIYDFGIKRISFFRKPGSSILLDVLTKYQSRHAEPHDFALNT